ncbi:YHS domain-containing protein [Yoonia sp. F2084L]|uniref:YHS domain-containing (seleno)protein n=1 Tax=Yoonia sp. F2084L TaxID=2926419 RepID=UPI001FF11D67|nr:YHS domain-containing (seleno)protein [Yoonia sp. F2084L]MCK0094541.1 YHS domain-containing protein [Yoonia sp. F2084L]
MTFTRRHFFTLALAVPAAAALAPRAMAATPEVYNNDGVAVDGSDVVAYFTEGAPVAGDAAITHDYMGVTWRFSSEANRDAFAADPEAYAPKYGGYCAFAVSQGYTASTVPEAWTIVEDKLYLNFSTSVRRRWERDIPGHIMAADANWPGVLS